MNVLHQAEAMALSSMVSVVASAAAAGVSDAVWIAALATIAPTLTGIALILQNRRATTKIVEGQAVTNTAVKQVHEVANSRLTDALSAIDALKEEVSRLNAGGSPSPAAREVVSITQTPTGLTRVEPASVALPPPPTPKEDL